MRVRLVILILYSLAATVFAGVAGTEANVTRGFLSTAEMEAFVDGVIPAQLKSLHIPGAAIAVVADGKLYFAKGYGIAELKTSRRVEPETTIFRIGSVTKLFTWTAVMQLAEQGRLDLNADVNTYLKSFKVPATYPEPITMNHLLTHTAGP